MPIKAAISYADRAKTEAFENDLDHDLYLIKTFVP